MIGNRFLLFVFLFLMSTISHGGTPDGSFPDSDLGRPGVSHPGNGEFYARVLHEHDLHDVNVYEVEVKVIPSTGRWPGVQVVNETIKEVNIHTLIRIRGLSGPGDHLSRLRSHVAVEREREYFIDAMEFLWKVLSAHEYLILSGPVLLELPVGSGAYVTEVDAFLEIGGVRVSLADTLIFAGHSDAGRAGDHNWGMRHVPEK